MWKKLRDMRELDKEDLLELIGLQSRRSAMESVMPALGLFGLGVLVGAGIGLMMAPKSGAELREDLRERLTGGPDQMAATFPPMVPAERASKSP